MNNITIAGVLGKDPELKQVGQDQVLSFTVADSQGKEKPTLWWNCQMWGKRATTLQQYMTKGQKVTVSGNIQMREYTDKDGNKKYITEIVCSEMKMLGGKSEQSANEHKQPAERKTAADNVKPNNQSVATDDFDDSQLPF
jgi:single-strand DNA-binding protein